MASRESVVRNLVQALQHSDSKLYSMLQPFIDDVYTIYNELHPPSTGRRFGITSSIAHDTLVTNLTALVFPTTLRLSFDRAAGAFNYEVRFQIGLATDWDSATFITTTPSTVVNIDPVTLPMIYGSYTFLVKTIDSSGIEGDDAASVVVTINTIPVPVISPTVIDNNVLLYWTIPASQFAISSYNIYKDGVLTGTINSTFIALFETTSGNYEYGVEAVDIVGNVSTRGVVTAAVNQPPDFELTDLRTSALSGTKTNAYLEDGFLLVCVDITETYEEHFVNNGFAGP